MEYLFRGKRVDGKGWVYGYLAQNQGHSWILIPQEGIVYQCFVWEEVIPETVGQFIGLTDKNSIRIFKGDIYQIADNGIYVIRYCIDREEHDNEVYGATFLLDRGVTAFPFDEYALDNGKIIGNIHDNPELIEGIN